MRFLRYFLVVAWSVTFLSCSYQVAEAQVEISIPTIEQEATSIWRTINDIVFLEKQGYQINLPENEVIDALLEKSKNNQFGNSDFEEIYNMLESSVYDKNKYEVALEKVKAQADLINNLVTQLKIKKNTWDWTFHTFDQYNVVFTLYGTGGSYDPDTGLVTLFTNEAGKFMRYDNPANTILHEIVHMGIEKSIVQTYNLPHGLKERMVDKITYLLFGDKLPDYNIQNMGDPKIDSYLRDENDLKNLEALVIKYQKEK